MGGRGAATHCGYDALRGSMKSGQGEKSSTLPGRPGSREKLSRGEKGRELKRRNE